MDKKEREIKSLIQFVQEELKDKDFEVVDCEEDPYTITFKKGAKEVYVSKVHEEPGYYAYECDIMKNEDTDAISFDVITKDTGIKKEVLLEIIQEFLEL